MRKRRKKQARVPAANVQISLPDNLWRRAKKMAVDLAESRTAIIYRLLAAAIEKHERAQVRKALAHSKGVVV